MQVALDGLYRGGDLSMFQFAVCKPWFMNQPYWFRSFWYDRASGHRCPYLLKNFHIFGTKCDIWYVTYKIHIICPYKTVPLNWSFSLTMIKLEDLQKLFNHPNPIKCLHFPLNKKFCDECESILAVCLMECNEDSSCISICNRDYVYCTENCK